MCSNHTTMLSIKIKMSKLKWSATNANRYKRAYYIRQIDHIGIFLTSTQWKQDRISRLTASGYGLQAIYEKLLSEGYYIRDRYTSDELAEIYELGKIRSNKWKQ